MLYSNKLQLCLLSQVEETSNSIIVEELAIIRRIYGDSLVIIVDLPRVFFVGLYEPVTISATRLRSKLKKESLDNRNHDLLSSADNSHGSVNDAHGDNGENRQMNRSNFTEKQVLDKEENDQEMNRTNICESEKNDREANRRNLSEKQVLDKEGQRGIEVDETKNKNKNSTARSGNGQSVSMRGKSNSKAVDMSHRDSFTHETFVSSLQNKSPTKQSQFETDSSRADLMKRLDGEEHNEDNKDEDECGSKACTDMRSRLSPTYQSHEETVFRCGFNDRLAVAVWVQDITRIKVDAIVNAANAELDNIGGVAGAIERLGGDEFAAGCRRYVEIHGPLKVQRYVFHLDYGTVYY